LTSPNFRSWSPQGRGLGLEAPQGQPIVSLALALARELKFLTLALASDAKSSTLAVGLGLCKNAYENRQI